ncbi:MAG: hypothetical protein HZC40_12635 [Chloroflexi bacterium]|nr:hypothetical protein [Chloroflexota bacterium]
MDTQKFIVRVGAIAGAVGALILAAMIAVGTGAGVDLAKTQSLVPAIAQEAFKMQAGAIQTVMVLDDLFVVAYVVTFIALATYVRERAGWLALIALVFALITGALDFFENSITLALVATAHAGIAFDPTTLFAMNIVTQMKYLATNIAVGIFGIALWNSPAISDRGLGALLILFAPINVIAFVNPAFAVVRIFAMLGLLVVGAIVLGQTVARTARPQ